MRPILCSAYFDDTAIARRELLSRRPAGEVERPADVREDNVRVFGRDLTPSEAVDEIIAAVRNDGDAGLRRFERELGGNRRETLLVQPEEFDKGRPARVRRRYAKHWRLLSTGCGAFTKGIAPKAGWISTRPGRWDRSSGPWSG